MATRKRTPEEVAEALAEAADLVDRLADRGILIMRGPEGSMDEVKLIPLPRPTNVIGAIAAVMEEIGGVRKMTAAQRAALGLGGGDTGGLSYAYRGIDQIAQAAQPLFGKYGVVMVPSVLEQHVTDLIIKSNPWTDTWVTVQYRIYGPGGVDDCITAEVTGVGRDNSDKGINKAMTGAFKNLLLRLLCIGDPQDDTDGHTHEADALGAPIDPRPEPPAPHAADVLFEKLLTLKGTPIAEELKAWADKRGMKLSGVELRADSFRADVEEKLRLLLEAQAQTEAEGPTRTVEQATEALAEVGMLAPDEPGSKGD